MVCADAPSLGDFDVLVVGAGSAGATAAISAARAGASVALIERHGFLGGTSTAVLDTFYGFYTPGSQRKVVGGVADEVVAGLTQLGTVIERPNSFGAGTGVTYHPEHLKVVWERLAQAAGVQIFFYSMLQDCTVADGRLTSALIATKAGLRRVTAKTVIDASGDADVCHFAGFDYELAGELEPAQTLTTTFKLCNVDIEKRQSVSKTQLAELMRAAGASEQYALPRLEGSDHITPVDNMTATIMTRISSFERRGHTTVNATDPQLLAKAEMSGREQALEYVRFLRDRVPGYQNAQLSTFSQQIGVRETRRVYGDYRLTRDDVLGARQFDDQIALCGAPIEDHHDGADTAWAYLPDGQAVGIPFRSLLVRDASNVLVAGRCFSATHDAHASVRSMAQCMAMGQAAGSAAALAVARSGSLRELSVSDLQQELRTSGAILDAGQVQHVRD